ncbi:MAG: ATP phosphoribosyltransferase regulatory subunit [Nitrospira sp.]|nr:ATP phosphoribosyltransferase regulatory subunit [Nitrospira sp.]MEB2338092.1 ATP phosphoribosyltransferase regulatory subunit [Nitrospirales bacterium]QOJ36270.1 MAG: ATP phosphoribosyltransferase regulatory subunit [Nitrospira sp.]
MSTILPQAAHRIRHLEHALLAVLSKGGYEEIILPMFEYHDVLAPGLEADLLEKCYRIVDRTTGRLLLLRPDATAQIARTVAMGMMGNRLPIRLCYRTSVFRHEREHSGRDREIFQVGAELIGVAGVAGDAEILTYLIECLQRVGLASFKVAVGHVGFFTALLVRSGLSTEGQKRVEQAAARKDLPLLEELLAREGVSRATTGVILNALELCGGPEVLARGRKLVGRDRALLGTLDHLSQVYDRLSSAAQRQVVLLDLGEFRGFEYYDGMVFDVFASGIGAELGGGGRYDHLLGRFGHPAASTGFALDVDRLFRAIDSSEDGAPSASKSPTCGAKPDSSSLRTKRRGTRA